MDAAGPLAASVLCALHEAENRSGARVCEHRRLIPGGGQLSEWRAVPDHQLDEHGEPRAHDADRALQRWTVNPLHYKLPNMVMRLKSRPETPHTPARPIGLAVGALGRTVRARRQI